MTADAIGKIANTLFQVFRGDLIWVMLMATVTGVSLQVVRMTGLAGTASAMVQWEAMRLVELGRRPGLGIVAGGAVGGEQTGMEGRVGVAGDTLLGCALEYIVHMAFGAIHTGMCPGQLECSLGVVETGFLPIIWCVANATIYTKFTLVSVILGVAGITFLRRAFEEVINMALSASYFGVRTGELESSLGVVEGRLFPVIWSMAAGAIHAKLALVCVIFGVAGGAILFGRLEVRQPARPRVTGGASD